jgi:hypothetical protein
MRSSAHLRIGALRGAMLGLASIALIGGAPVAAADPSAAPAVQPAMPTQCKLGPNGAIKHVIYLQFDNVHYRQDRSNVASDLQQMPHLLNFLTNNGTLITNDHTILISHTAGGIVSSLTGLYPDRNGQTVSNSYDYFQANGVPTFQSSFKYWNNTVAAAADPLPNMVTDGGATTPAPWSTYTDAGCTVGGVSAANIELENATAVRISGGPTPLTADANPSDTVLHVGSTSGFSANEVIDVDGESATILSVQGSPTNTLTLKAGLGSGHPSGSRVMGTVANDPTGDVTSLFGQGSDAWNEARDSQEALPGTAARNLGLTDLVGVAIHCAKGTSPCQGNPNARPDPTTIYPGSDDGFQGIFGTHYVNPSIGGHGANNRCISATDGTDITDSFGQCGFPGFDGALAKNTLGEVEAMQFHGVPVTYAYISDAHDNHVTTSAMGPGEAAYKQQLKDYDNAFATFFGDLVSHGIDKTNTLFVVTVDEGDHFVGGTGTPSGQDLTYTHDPCKVTQSSPTCPSDQMGEIVTNLKAVLPNGEPSFDLHFDDAPTIYVNGQPNRNDSSLRQLERDLASTTLFDPYAGGAAVPIVQRLADSVGERTLHMVNADPKRTPSFTMFGNSDFFFQASNSTTCAAPTAPECVASAFAWNHGDYQQEIANTWMGMVGPGVKHLGINSSVWTDHTDLRATMMVLLGLKDAYEDDGRAITQIIKTTSLPSTLTGNTAKVESLANAWKKVNAPFGRFGLDALRASTRALKQPSTQAGDLKYDQIETTITKLTDQRNALVNDIRSAMNDAAKGVAPIDSAEASRWIARANDLDAQMADLANH